MPAVVQGSALSKPAILLPDVGAHNRDLPKAQDRILRGQGYKDCSTVCVIPARDVWYPRCAQTWFNLMAPMNQQFVRMAITGMEVGEAYSTAVATILGNEVLAKFKYMLTLETDNAPPPDGLLKLIESIEGGVDGSKYDVMASLYWTKGPGGMPMAYGRPDDMPLNFRPWLPPLNSIARVNGTGMGFTLFRLKMFADPRMPQPPFKTIQEYDPQKGARAYTQDLAWAEAAGKLGYRIGIDTRVLVGHWDQNEEVMW